MCDSKQIPELAIDAHSVKTSAMGVVHAEQRCFVVYRTANAPSTTEVFVSPEDALAHLQQRGVGAKRTGSPLADGACVWMDLQGGTDAQNRRAVQLLFPSMQPSQMDAVLLPDAYDVVELQPVRGQYLVGSLACSRGRVRSLSAAPSDAVADDDEPVLCSFACDEQCVLTMHATPFVGLAEVLRYVEGEFGARDLSKQQPLLQREFLSASEDASTAPSMTGAAILCTLVCFTCEAFMPDPTSLLSEVGNIDEMVLLISPGQQDQADLLRRVALLRRRIASLRTGLYLKEKLLQELMVPSMRVSFAAKESDTVRAYKDTLEKVRRVSERLDDTRDMLNQANLNFVTGVSMRMSQASAGLDFKLTILNQVAAVCLPMNLLISIFGMNTKIPFISDQWDTLVPFACVCGVLVVWSLVCLTPLLREAIRGSTSKAIAPNE